jgi:hypothetical protein
MSNLNLDNKILVFPQFNLNRGRTQTRELINTVANGDTVSTEVKLTEVITNKKEAEIVSKFESRARQALLKHTSPGPKGMHILSTDSRANLEATLKDLQEKAADLNSQMTVCNIAVDCIILPVELTVDASTANKVRESVQQLLMDLREKLCSPLSALAPDPGKRYSDARAAYYRAQNVYTFAYGLNADIVKQGLQEAADACVRLKSESIGELPTLEAAIAVFDQTAMTTDEAIDLPF